ncbi:hypothetical protein G7Z17_g10638 [Cylindrodendrum hubeiense]|uniref:F-box domain-containing protein n=1 Tax=Cylindrodendrum hubeiense TaxID=595255 RepID=A0A9P5H1S0_9HYPO|nr:hypothetical protein G7Z17_g10638 [Cylindrodendrum hubeiense]
MLLTNLPSEVLHLVLQWLDPADIVILPRVCSLLYAFTKGNKALCRAVYLKHLDNPKDADLDWYAEVHDLVRLQVICRRSDAVEKKHELDFVYDVVNRLLSHASPSPYTPSDAKTHATSLNASLLNELFSDESTLEAFLQRSFLFERVRSEIRHPIRASSGGPSKALLHQRSAKLHCLYGKPILTLGPTRASRTYPYACSKVYDLRQYTERTHWGPFLDDGSDRVDWEKVEAILIVLGKNIGSRRFVSDLFREVWDNPFSGSWPGSYMTVPGPEISSLENQDPYDVTGTWYRIVCFLDYNDFFSYNFPVGDLIDPDTPRPALDVGEATRILQMNIHVVKIEPPGPNDGQDLPVVHFRGVTRSLDDSFDDNANSQMRGLGEANVKGLEMKGTVRLTREGEVRWTTFTIFNGQERWRSEGIQVGGVRSARGVVGNWFDRDYDAHGPAGPTAFWKGPMRDRAKRVGDDMLPSEFFVPYAILLRMDVDPDGHEDAGSDNGEDDYEDDDDDGEEEVQQVTITVETNRPPPDPDTNSFYLVEQSN